MIILKCNAPNCGTVFNYTWTDSHAVCPICGNVFPATKEFAVLDQITKPKDPIKAMLAERGSRYGEFDRHSEITQAIKAAMVNSPKWASLPSFMKEALEMIAHKIGRILNGDPWYDDSWQDIIGYTQLVLNKVKEKFNAKSSNTPD